jgi:hypothetical protein
MENPLSPAVQVMPFWVADGRENNIQWLTPQFTIMTYTLHRYPGDRRMDDF